MMPRALATVTNLPAPRERATRQKPGVERPAHSRGRKPVLHNAHDVKRLETQVNALLTAIRTHLPPGRDIGMQMIEVSARSYAVARLLVMKGLVQETEIQAEMLAAMNDILAGVLQGVEDAALRAQSSQAVQASQGPQVQAVRMPDLIRSPRG